MSRLYVQEGAWGDPTIWLETEDPDRPKAVMARTTQTAEGFDALVEVIERVNQQDTAGV